MRQLKESVFLPRQEDFMRELFRIANWWRDNAIDQLHGGFIGQINADGSCLAHAHKSIILNTRILWFFSELSLFLGIDHYRQLADRAFNYIINYFDDRECAGVFWELDHRGKLVNGKKQSYALAFSIYALCAYYQLTSNSLALDKAKFYFKLLEAHALDSERGGYLEAFSRYWTPIDDMRLSDHDANMPKTMNTHLHLLEAYSALYKVDPSTEHAQALRRVITYFQDFFINTDTLHLRLFFDNQWSDHSKSYSFGHDIESSWLIWEAAQTLGDQPLLNQLQPLLIAMARVCVQEGLGRDGRVFDEFCFHSAKTRKESCWWVQAEAMVGFLNAYRLSGDADFVRAFSNVWSFVQAHYIDYDNGEWRWHASTNLHNRKYKMGFWKAPYHNGRAMMEICRLLQCIEARSLTV